MDKCNVFQAANMVGRKWMMVVLQEISLNGNKGFNFILKRMGKISPKILSSRLKELETNGLVKKSIVNNKPLKTRYELTQKGKDFHNIIRNIKQWNAKYSSNYSSNIVECDRRECVRCELY